MKSLDLSLIFVSLVNFFIKYTEVKKSHHAVLGAACSSVVELHELMSHVLDELLEAGMISARSRVSLGSSRGKVGS